jgi:hypothetical protein
LNPDPFSSFDDLRRCPNDSRLGPDDVIGNRSEEGGGAGALKSGDSSISLVG